jgi:predicted transcriptional regulator
MAKAKRALLGRVELELLQYVDQHPSVSVGDAATEFGAPRGLARTTVLTMMQRLVAKGFLKRKQVGSLHRYETKVSAPLAVTELVADFVRGVLGGSVSPFITYLNQTHDLSQEDVAELRELVAGLEQRPSARSRKKTNKPEKGDL